MPTVIKVPNRIAVKGPNNWGDIWDEIKDAGDFGGAAKAQITKIWKGDGGLEQIVKAGADLQFAADGKVMEYKVIPGKANLKALKVPASRKFPITGVQVIKTPVVPADKVIPKVDKGVKGTLSDAKKAIAESSAEERTKITIQLMSSGGQIKSIAIAIAGTGGASLLGPAGPIIAGLSLLNTVGGLLVGYVNSRKKWGEEINKSLTSRAAEWTKEALQARRMGTLKKHGPNSVAARLEYVGFLQIEVKKLRESLPAHTTRADAIMEAQQNFLKEWNKALQAMDAAEKEVHKIIKEKKGVLTRTQADELQGALKKIGAEWKKLFDMYNSQIGEGTSDDLYERGTNTINSISAEVARINKEIEEIQSRNWFEEQAKAAAKGAAPGTKGPGSTAKQTVATRAVEGFLDLAGVLVDVTEFIADPKVSAINDLVNDAASVANTAETWRKDRVKKWKIIDKDLVDRVGAAIRKKIEDSRKSRQNPKWKENARLRLKEMRTEVEGLKHRQTEMESMALKSNEDVKQIVEKYRKERADYEHELAEFKKKGEALMVRLNAGAEDPAAKPDQAKKAQQTAKQLLEVFTKCDRGFAALKAQISRIEALALKENEAIANALNEGIEQDINKIQVEIEKLAAEVT